MTLEIPNSDDEQDCGIVNQGINPQTYISQVNLECEERIYSDQEEIQDGEVLFFSQDEDQAENCESSRFSYQRNQLLIGRKLGVRTRECENRAPHRNLVSTAAKRGPVHILSENVDEDVCFLTLQVNQHTKNSQRISVTSFIERGHSLVTASSGDDQYEGKGCGIPVASSKKRRESHPSQHNQSEHANYANLGAQRSVAEKSNGKAESKIFHEQKLRENSLFENAMGVFAGENSQSRMQNNSSDEIYTMYSKLKEVLPESNSKTLGAKRAFEHVNKGWGTNFVRTNLKVSHNW